VRISKPAWSIVVIIATAFMVLLVLYEPLLKGRFPPESTKVTLHSSSGATHTLSAEVVTTPRQMERGLSGRKQIGDDEGMLFVFPGVRNPDTTQFNMGRMLFPLDIAFIDQDGVVVGIITVPPCRTLSNLRACPRYPSPEPFLAALEVNAGLLDSLGIQVGDRIEWVEVPTKCWSASIITLFR